MGLFDFLRNKKLRINTELIKTPEPEAKSKWTGKDFEFLITGDINISTNDYDSIMTPKSFDWTKKMRDDWPYYKVGQDEFSYSWEMSGIQLTFNKEIPFKKAKAIVDEVIININETGQQAELVILDKTKVYKC